METTTNLLKPITDENFEEIVSNATEPVVIDFWAPWCAPCRTLTPTIEAVAKQYQGKVTFCKIDVQENPKTPAHFSVRGIPTLMLFQNGKVIASKTGGNMSQSTLCEFIDSNIQ